MSCARLSRLPFLYGALALALAAPLPAAAGAANLLTNGDFSQGSASAPQAWRPDAWLNSPRASSFQWTAAGGKPAELTIRNLKPNDARWVQTLKLGPGWYRASVEARAENVGPNGAGASLCLLDDNAGSAELRGSTSWQKLTLYFKVEAPGADLEIALRLGGFSRLNTGTAFFRNARVVLMAGSPSPGAAVFDLAALRRQRAPVPVGRPWSLVAVFAALAVAGAVGWRLLAALSDGPGEAKPG